VVMPEKPKLPTIPRPVLPMELLVIAGIFSLFVIALWAFRRR